MEPFDNGKYKAGGFRKFCHLCGRWCYPNNSLNLIFATSRKNALNRTDEIDVVKAHFRCERRRPQAGRAPLTYKNVRLFTGRFCTDSCIQCVQILLRTHSQRSATWNYFLYESFQKFEHTILFTAFMLEYSIKMLLLLTFWPLFLYSPSKKSFPLSYHLKLHSVNLLTIQNLFKIGPPVLPFLWLE